MVIMAFAIRIQSFYHVHPSMQSAEIGLPWAVHEAHDVSSILPHTSLTIAHDVITDPSNNLSPIMYIINISKCDWLSEN